MSAVVAHVRCPDCGTELGSDGASAGLCPRCLLSLAVLGSPPEPTQDVGSQAPTLAAPATGRILGERYQMREMLGRGGMGEVWQAFDLKLRVDVALKSVRGERLGSEHARDLLRQEVRSAREVVSPNVCRIFDLVEEDGRELVSMEYIDGTTLTEMLGERGPLGLQDAREIASQFLSGLEAIHQAGLVHRDFKPENVMLTRAGRVVVMDFGLAKGLTERETGTVAGTPAYMAPEQSRGEAVDARADVYAAGVVLAEMLTVGGARALSVRRDLWKAVREEPPRVPEGPWARVLTQALDRRPEGRPESARALARALEEVTLRLPGFEEERPYPGLSAFTEEDAEYFHGREAEVEAVWKKLKRPRLLALIGPSGTGKSSFLRAGLLATLPSGWAAVVATPGDRPFQALARALVPFFAGDTGATEALLRFEDLDTAVSLLQGLREKHDHALVVVDQFEELFTQCPPETQEAFAELLGRLVLEADVHVLVSLRDDFLFQCHGHDALTPILNELTLLGPLSESALRRALVQPALACGYRFEDEALVEEMVAEVGRERGALPLLAFAASRLWDKRDRERGLLTREACQEIGGVAGALAQHAEDTLERIGQPRIPLVRELFRNLVTAQGTRAARERTELLSVFEEKDRAAADEVLAALVDARLLTSFEQAGDESDESHQEIEIIHESLLSRWPRLVRWQTQDADGAQLRDQLRQAAQAWQDRGRPEDLLWSGTAYRDLALWKERYTGGLTEAEEAFTAGSARMASRRRRRRRMVGASLLAAAAAIAIATSTLWQRAEEEARRAEAGKLLALAQIEIDDFPTQALAYATRSLELSDSEEGRLFALRALQRGPAARVAPAGGDGLEAHHPAFSPDGAMVAVGGYRKIRLLHRDGRPPTFRGDYSSQGFQVVVLAFAAQPDILVSCHAGDLRASSVADGTEIWSEKLEGPTRLFVRGERLFTATSVPHEEGEPGWLVRQWTTASGTHRVLGTVEGLGSFDPWGREYVYMWGRKVLARAVDGWDTPRLVAEHEVDLRWLDISPDGLVVAVSDDAEVIRIWPTSGALGRPWRVFSAPKTPWVSFDPTGRWLGAHGVDSPRTMVRVWDLSGPPAAAPLVLRRDDTGFLNGKTFDPGGRWLATANVNDVAFWPLPERAALVLKGHEGRVDDLVFTPDGERLVSASGDGTVRAWPLSASGEQEPRLLLRTPMSFPGLALAPGGERVAVSGRDGRVFVVPFDGASARELEGFSKRTQIMAVAFSPDGRKLAAAPFVAPTEEKVVRVWPLEGSAAPAVIPLPGGGEGYEGGVYGLFFRTPGRLLAATHPAGDVAIDLDRGEARELHEAGQEDREPLIARTLSQDRRFAVGVVSPDMEAAEEEDVVPAFELVRYGLESGASRFIATHGTGVGGVKAVALDPGEARLATGDFRGTVRIGRVSGEAPHVFFGHEGLVRVVRFSPDGRWLASGGDDGTIRLWPVPEESQTPFHILPRRELLQRLHSITNLRVVADPASPGGYKLERGPFPGWAEVPEW